MTLEFRCSAVWVAGCWSGSDVELHKVHCVHTSTSQLEEMVLLSWFRVLLSWFLFMVTIQARDRPGRVNNMHKMFLISI